MLNMTTISEQRNTGGERKSRKKNDSIKIIDMKNIENGKEIRERGQGC